MRCIQEIPRESLIFGSNSIGVVAKKTNELFMSNKKADQKDRLFYWVLLPAYVLRLSASSLLRFSAAAQSRGSTLATTKKEITEGINTQQVTVIA